MSKAIGDRVVHDQATGDAVLPGPRGEELRFQGIGALPTAPVTERPSAAGAIGVTKGLVMPALTGGEVLSLAAPTVDGEILLIAGVSGSDFDLEDDFLTPGGTGTTNYLFTGECVLGLVGVGGKWQEMFKVGVTYSPP